MRHIYKYKILNPSLYRRVRYKLKHNYDEYDVSFANIGRRLDGPLPIAAELLSHLP